MSLFSRVSKEEQLAFLNDVLPQAMDQGIMLTAEDIEELYDNQYFPQKAQEEWEESYKNGGRIRRLYNKIPDDNPVKQSILDDNRPYITNPDGTVSTHLMGSYGNYAIPLVQPRLDGGGVEIVKGNPYSRAMQTGHYIEFDRPRQAKYFAKHYKELPGLHYYDEGDELDEGDEKTHDKDSLATWQDTKRRFGRQYRYWRDNIYKKKEKTIYPKLYTTDYENDYELFPAEIEESRSNRSHYLSNKYLRDLAQSDEGQKVLSGEIQLPGNVNNRKLRRFYHNAMSERDKALRRRAQEERYAILRDPNATDEQKQRAFNENIYEGQNEVALKFGLPFVTTAGLGPLGMATGELGLLESYNTFASPFLWTAANEGINTLTGGRRKSIGDALVSSYINPRSSFATDLLVPMIADHTVNISPKIPEIAINLSDKTGIPAFTYYLPKFLWDQFNIDKVVDLAGKKGDRSFLAIPEGVWTDDLANKVVGLAGKKGDSSFLEAIPKGVWTDDLANKVADLAKKNDNWSFFWAIPERVWTDDLANKAVGLAEKNNGYWFIRAIPERVWTDDLVKKVVGLAEEKGDSSFIEAIHKWKWTYDLVKKVVGLAEEKGDWSFLKAIPKGVWTDDLIKKVIDLAEENDNWSFFWAIPKEKITDWVDDAILDIAIKKSKLSDRNSSSSRYSDHNVVWQVYSGGRWNKARAYKFYNAAIDNKNPDLVPHDDVNFWNLIEKKDLKKVTEIPEYDSFPIVRKELNKVDIIDKLYNSEKSTFYRTGFRAPVTTGLDESLIKTFNGYAIPTGSYHLYKAGLLSELPGDLDFVTTRSRLSDFKKNNHISNTSQLVNGEGERMIVSGKEVDVMCIGEDLKGMAAGKEAHEIAAALHPNEYAKFINDSKNKNFGSFAFTDKSLPWSAEELYMELQKDPDAMLKVNLSNYIGSAKPKHVARTYLFPLLANDSEIGTISNVIKDKLTAIYGEKSPGRVADIFPNIKFDNLNDNISFLRYLPVYSQEEINYIAQSPERTRLTLDIYYFSRSQRTRRIRQDPKFKKVSDVEQWLNSFSDHGGGTDSGIGENSLSGSPTGAGKNYGQVLIVYKDNPTFKLDEIKSPFDIIKAFDKKDYVGLSHDIINSNGSSIANISKRYDTPVFRGGKYFNNNSEYVGGLGNSSVYNYIDDVSNNGIEIGGSLQEIFKDRIRSPFKVNVYNGTLPYNASINNVPIGTVTLPVTNIPFNVGGQIRNKKFLPYEYK